MSIRGLETNELWRYAQEALASPVVLPNTSARCILHTPVGDIEPVRVERVFFQRDYSAAFAEKINLVLTFKRGEALNHIKANKETLTVSFWLEGGLKPIVYEKIRAIPLVHGDEGKATGDPGIVNTQDLDQFDLEPIVFECGDIKYEQWKRQNFLSYPMDTTLKNAIETLYCPQRYTKWDQPPTHNVPTPQAVYERTYGGGIGVDVVEPQNPNKYDVVFIPKEIKFHRLIPFLQEAYGLYSEGAGRFHQDGLWFVYPVFNTSRYDREEQTLTVINIPSDRLPSVEANFSIKDKNLFVLATDEVQVNDDTWLRTLAEGDGVRYLNATRVMDDFAIRKGGKVKFQQADNVVSRSVNPRPDNYNDFITETAKGGARANHYAAFSQLAHKRGSVINVMWRYGDAALLYPGQPSAFLYAEGDTVKKLTGTLLGVNINYQNNNPRALEDITYNRDVMLTLFVGEPE